MHDPQLGRALLDLQVRIGPDDISVSIGENEYVDVLKRKIMVTLSMGGINTSCELMLPTMLHMMCGMCCLHRWQKTFISCCA